MHTYHHTVPVSGSAHMMTSVLYKALVVPYQLHVGELLAIMMLECRMLVIRMLGMSGIYWQWKLSKYRVLQ